MTCLLPKLVQNGKRAKLVTVVQGRADALSSPLAMDYDLTDQLVGAGVSQRYIELVTVYCPNQLDRIDLAQRITGAIKSGQAEIEIQKVNFLGTIFR